MILHLQTVFCLAFYFYSSSGEPVELDVSNSGHAREYCLATEPFQAKCMRNEVIVMTSALYGRMRVGRCLQNEDEEMLATNRNNPRYLGCSVDVLHTMDRRCSGRNQCEVKLVSDPDLQRELPCNAALKSYLEASYDCVAVIEADRSCHVSVSSNPLHIMRTSSTSALLNCGTKTQPWVLEAPAGQQINVSLLDFRQRAGTRERGAERQHCRQPYGYIVDKATNASKNVSICGLAADERNRIIYQSASSAVEIILQNSPIEDVDNQDESWPVLFGFRAVGCFNVVPPEDAWLRRSNNEAVVGCYSSRQSWHLRCVDNVWVGVIENCTRENDVVQAVKSKATPNFDNQVLITVAIAVVSLIVCVVIIVCGAVCLRRYIAVMSKGSGYIHHEEDKLGGGGGKYGHGTNSTQQAPLHRNATRNEQLLLQA